MLLLRNCDTRDKRINNRQTYYISVNDNNTSGTFSLCVTDQIDYDYKSGALPIASNGVLLMLLMTIPLRQLTEHGKLLDRSCKQKCLVYF